MPKMSDTMTTGVLVKWLKKVGSKVSSGDILAEVETDKATMELEAYEEGTLLYCVEEGKTVLVDAVIAVVGEKGESHEALLRETPETSVPAPGPVGEVISPSPRQDEIPPIQKVEEANANSARRVKASPLARSLAREAGYDLERIKGTGPEGRIIKRDVEAFSPAAGTPSGREGYTTLPFTQMRSAIARRLVESKFTAPHFYVSMSTDMEAVTAARARMNAVAPVKISFNDIVLKACALSLVKHPAINSALLGDSIRQYHHVHIGVAVAVPDGLVVPVIRFANTKTLSALSAEVKDFVQRAKDKTLKPQDWEGSTFTVSNLGMYGVDAFTAIINPPNTCILAVGGIEKVVRETQAGVFSSVPVMKVTLSCDHRAVDGAQGAEFLNTLRDLLEDPVRMLI